MLVTALCTACFSRNKINKNLLAPYLKIRPPYRNATRILLREGLENEKKIVTPF